MTEEITALKAWEMLSLIDTATLVDVRTEAEWSNLGRPYLEGRVLYITSHQPPMMSLRPEFLAELEKSVKPGKNPLIFICRSAARSKIAATIAKEHGYKNTYYIIDGYEGSESGPGWKLSKLPCRV